MHETGIVDMNQHPFYTWKIGVEQILKDDAVKDASARLPPSRQPVQEKDGAAAEKAGAPG